MFEAVRAADCCQLRAPAARWLATGWDGGVRAAPAATNLTVPTGFHRADLDAYATERFEATPFERSGPVLLTGVSMAHACVASADGVTVVATAGLSNPAALAVDEAAQEESAGGPDRVASGESSTEASADADDEDGPPLGTVNLLVGTERALADGALATLLATAVEAKTATLGALTGFTGTTSDAVAVGCRPDGDARPFAGSATEVGDATRRCVRDAIAASLAARYPDDDWPATVAAADHGTRTTGPTETGSPRDVGDP
jgi:adenosylcobinamide hydrolase